MLVYTLSVSTFLAISSLVSYGFIGLAIIWTVVYRRKSQQKLALLKESNNESDRTEIALSFKTPEGEAQFKAAYHENLKFWTVPYESFYVYSEFGQTHIIASGPKDAAPLILLHGFGFSATMWYANIEALSHQYHVYALDVLSDINKSVVTKPFQDKNDCAKWLCTVLDELGIEKATIMGHSAGGWQAINFAINAPNRVKNLILLAPAASFVPLHKQFYVRQVAVALVQTRTVVIRFFCKWFVANGNVVNEGLYEQFFIGIKNFKWSKVIFPSVFTDAELQRIQVPTLLLIGDREVIYNPLSAMNRAKQFLPKLTTEIVPHAGHFLSAERADFVNKSMLDFLKKQHS